MLWKKAARVVLHKMGVLSVVRSHHRRELRVLMFHSFSEQDQSNVQAICSHITHYFEPVSLSTVVGALNGVKPLPDNAVAITVDDGYRNFFLYGHPVFRRNRIPVTVYAVAAFSEGDVWLWPDQIEFGLRHTPRTSIRAQLGEGEPLELALRTSDEKADAIFRLTEALKEVANHERLAFLAEFGKLCGVDIPPHPPSGLEAMSWDELRAVASEGAEIGCHTETHPILSRLSDPSELEREIRGAKEHMQERLGFDIRHFSYPNGRPMDVDEAAIRCVREAGFDSGVSTTHGMNTLNADRFQIRRLAIDSGVDLPYGEELLAGLHV